MIIAAKLGVSHDRERLGVSGPAMRTAIPTTLLAFLTVFSFAGIAQAACVRPDTGALTDQRVMGFQRTLTTPLKSSGAPLRWVSVSGTSGMQGEIFVVDCGGSKRGDIGLGAVEMQKPGPVVEGRPSLIVIYHSDLGSNVINDQNVALLQYRKGAIVKLWDHDSFQGQYPPRSLGHQEEIIYNWRFTSDARKILVTGRHFVYRDRETNGALHKRDIKRIYPIKAENFCLNVKEMRYNSCH